MWRILCVLAINVRIYCEQVSIHASWSWINNVGNDYSKIILVNSTHLHTCVHCVMVPSAQTTISITVTFMCHSLISSLVLIQTCVKSFVLLYFHSKTCWETLAVTIQLYGCTTWTLTKPMEQKIDGNYTTFLEAAPHKTTAVWQLTSHLTNHPNETS